MLRESFTSKEIKGNVKLYIKVHCGRDNLQVAVYFKFKKNEEFSFEMRTCEETIQLLKR